MFVYVLRWYGIFHPVKNIYKNSLFHSVKIFYFLFRMILNNWAQLAQNTCINNRPIFKYLKIR